jgi:RNA polymerase sigma-70 factor (ECF subfamily)
MQNEAALMATLAVEDQHEAELVARAKDKSSEAWDEIYARHYPHIYRYVHARVFDSEVAADLTASVFLGAVKGIGSYRYQGQPLLAWLYRIARNVISSHQRTMFRQRTLSLNAVLELPGRVFGQKRQGAEPASPPEADPSTTVEQMDLRHALAGLPAAQRDVLVLKFFAGMDAKEIADVVGKEPAAVYSLQARGLQALRRRLS